MQEEIDPDVELDKMDNNSGDKNPSWELVVNNVGTNREYIIQNGTVVNS